MWHQQAEHPQWSGLNLLGVGGVIWRTPDTDENRDAFKSPSNHRGDYVYPQVRMVCQMEFTSHLQEASAFDRGFYSLILLNRWHQAGERQHWLMPMIKGTQFTVVKKLGIQDKIIKLAAPPKLARNSTTYLNQSKFAY